MFGPAVCFESQRQALPAQSGPLDGDLVEKLSRPGVISAQRYSASDGSETVTVIEAEAVGALREQSRGDDKTIEPLAQPVKRYLGQEIYRSHPSLAVAEDTPLLLAVWWIVPEHRQAEFGKWYEEEHIGMLTACNEWKMVRRIRLMSENLGDYNHLALHYLESEAALRSPQREAARNTVWRMKLAQESWFEAAYGVFGRWGARLEVKQA